MLSLSLWGISPANATTINETADPVPVTGQPADAALAKTKSLIKSKKTTVQASSKSLAFEEAAVYKISAANGSYTTVTIPIHGEYSLLSNFTVVFDNHGNVAQYTEMHLSENSEGNFRATNFTDGALTSERDSEIKFVNDAVLEQGVSQSLDVAMPAAKSTKNCLIAVLGVSGATATLLAWVCAGSCAAAAAGIGVPFCVACIAGYATIGGASITAVASCF
ncbi:hypothetical protein CIK84_18545 [Glutamicibacter arilaitensis]|uniref:Uncharacterized protein n=2 Tax=Micrococcaceae TaxID=1268 RepID=A0A2N7RXE8_9MICC|nr:hypothetical protein CIK84_18545 [Glutamicibacter arilaitensis]